MKRIKIGVFGAGRGLDIAKNFMMLNCEIVALFDDHPQRRENAEHHLGNTVAVYDDFDAFLSHEMDAVVLANYFYDHAPYAIRCFERGMHVYSECISNGTMAEGVALIRAYEKSNCIYMLAENYPQMIFNREIKRVCDSGTLGKILYAEGEYNHPVSPYDIQFLKTHTYFPKHWRNFLPRTYYITHSLGPIMWATGATPKRVSAFAVFAPVEEDAPSTDYNGDRVAIITTHNDDDSIFRVTGWAEFGAHHNSYRVCGTKGQIENLRGMGDRVMLRYNSWSKPADAEVVNLYEPSWNDKDEEMIAQSGHGGGDYLTARTFVDCIKTGKQPSRPFDLYSAVTMSSVALLAHRSVLDEGKPYDIPDFKLEECRRQYENDWLTPFYRADGGEPTLPCCSHPDYKPLENQVEKYQDMLGF